MIFGAKPYGNIVTSGLVLNLDATNPASYPGTGTTWFDRSGYNNNGTLTNGPTYLQERGRGSFVFDGTNDFVTGSCNLSGQNLTVNIWCYPTTTGVFKTPITNQIFDSVMTGYAIQQRNNGTFWVTVGIWGVAGDSVTGIPYSTNQWINLSMTYNGTTITAYKNGSVFGTVASTRTFSVGSLVIGAGERGNSEYFTGNISYVQIYNRALSQQEVLQNYNALKSRFV